MLAAQLLFRLTWTNPTLVGLVPPSLPYNQRLYQPWPVNTTSHERDVAKQSMCPARPPIPSIDRVKSQSVEFLATAGTQPCAAIVRRAHRDDDRSAAASLLLSSKNPHQISSFSCLENHRPHPTPRATNTTPQARIARTTLPCTSVSLKCRP